MPEKNHQAIDKTPVYNQVTPMENDDVIIVDTSSSSSMNTEKTCIRR